MNILKTVYHTFVQQSQYFFLYLVTFMLNEVLI